MTQNPTAPSPHGTGRLIVPCLWFDDQAQRAAEFYTTVFPRGHITATSHYPEGSDNPSHKPRGSVLTVEFEVAGQLFTALNGGPVFDINPSISFFVYADTVAETERLFAQLVEGGSALMPLGSYPWSERYGWVRDRFGVNWQVITGQRPETGCTIAPCLMFTGARLRQAEPALRAYAEIFLRGRVEALERYAGGEGPEGNVKHGRCSLGGQTLIAMDSHGDHRFTFNEGVSLQVMCDDQAEVDHYWEALSKGGEQVQCGWLKDRFGVSWQVVPSRIREWMTSRDQSARERAFQAVMRMKKLDIAAIDAAFRGGA